MNTVEPSATIREAPSEVSTNDPPVWSFAAITPADAAESLLYLRGWQKRLLDLTGAGILLIAFLPLMLVLVVSIRATSSGPALFCQRRCGHLGRQFTILKFRTMYASNIDNGSIVQARRHDPRVTPIGRFLRRSSLDELPQILNVLRGDMSLIGPRPHAVAQDLSYAPLIAGYSSRYLARPGMTGLAQVSGARGETPTVRDMERRIQFDTTYIRRASLMMDLRILVQTMRELFLSEQAY